LSTAARVTLSIKNQPGVNLVNWKIKCAAFYLLRILPHGTYDLAQKRVTGRFADKLTDEFLATYMTHVHVFETLPKGSTAVEFGSGRSLLTPLLLSTAGARSVLAFDVARLATVGRVNDIIGQLRQRGGDWPSIKDLDQDLWGKYRIRYVAPGDARATGLDAKSVDFVCSTSTLEHIPPDEIRAILDECRRICTPGALISMIIDYHDHYATSDPRISRFNFYRYSDALWKVLSPKEHYQNRLRHSDYEAMFADFKIVENTPIVPSDEMPPIRLAKRFQGYSAQDLRALNGIFTLRNW
jgi:hypothetical protein